MPAETEGREGREGGSRTTGAVRVVGLDVAGRHGWVGVVVCANGFVAARVGSLREIVAWAEPVQVVGVDIPIGGVGPGRRRADVEARRFLGPRASSVFAGPPGEVHGAASYAEANEVLTALGAPRLSRQSWALVPKVVEAAAVAAVDPRLHEIHPEVSFRAMAGEPLPWSKKAWNGLQLRRRLLAGAGIELSDLVDEVAGAASDDVVDAAAVAWSARRIAAGTACSLPDPPDPPDPADPADSLGPSVGRPAAIWY